MGAGGKYCGISITRWNVRNGTVIQCERINIELALAILGAQHTTASTVSVAGNHHPKLIRTTIKHEGRLTGKNKPPITQADTWAAKDSQKSKIPGYVAAVMCRR